MGQMSWNMQYVEAAGSISCFSFMSFHMLMVLMLNWTSRAKHSILLKDDLLSRGGGEGYNCIWSSFGEASSFTSQRCSRGKALRSVLCSSLFHSEGFIDNEEGEKLITFFKKSQNNGDNCNLCSSAKVHVWIGLGITGALGHHDDCNKREARTDLWQIHDENDRFVYKRSLHGIKCPT